jgi:tetratricopeptide (TPR) repeat protein
LALADLYQNHGDASKALVAYEAAQSQAADALSRALVFSAIGYAHENAGKCDAAIQAWESALNQGEAGLKVDLQMALARCSERVGNAAQAKTYYEKIMTDEPGSEAARTAELYKSQLVKP